jgi:hypothetical protein
MRWLFAMGLLAFVGLVVSLLMFAVGAYDAYAYRVGTPTTATIEQCTQAGNGSDQNCTATWSVGGTSHTGPIDTGGQGYPQGSSLNVHVHRGSAYTAAAASTNFWAGAAIAVLTLMLTAVVVLVVWWLRRVDRNSAARTQAP